MALNDTWSGVAKTGVATGLRKLHGSDKRELKARHIYAGFDGSQYGQFLFGQTETAFINATVAKTDIFNDYGDMANVYDGRQEGQAIYNGQWNGFGLKGGYITSNGSYDANYAGWSGVEGKMDHGYTLAQPMTSTLVWVWPQVTSPRASKMPPASPSLPKTVLSVALILDRQEIRSGTRASYTIRFLLFAALLTNPYEERHHGFNDEVARGYELGCFL